MSVYLLFWMAVLGTAYSPPAPEPPSSLADGHVRVWRQIRYAQFVVQVQAVRFGLEGQVDVDRDSIDSCRRIEAALMKRITFREMPHLQPQGPQPVPLLTDPSPFNPSNRFKKSEPPVRD